MKNSLTCDSVTIFKDNKKLIENIGFSVMPCGFIQLTGENGIGKTSLMRVIARLDTSNTGTIFYNGCNVDDYIDEYKKIILYISDKEQVIGSSTVYEILDFWGQIYNSELLIPAICCTFGLESYLETQIKFLSKGIKKRVVLSRLMLQKARIWLLDEPFTNLDQNSSDILNNIVRSHIVNGGIIIMIDHSMNFEQYYKKHLATIENIEYKLNDSWQLEKQKILLQIKDFKLNEI